MRKKEEHVIEERALKLKERQNTWEEKKRELELYNKKAEDTTTEEGREKVGNCRERGKT